MMKILIVVLALLNIVSCGISQELNSSLQKVKINAIEDDRLSNFHIIKFHFIGEEKKGSIISKIENSKCDMKLVIGSEYQIALEKLTSTGDITETTFRLYTNDIYIDGKLLFPKDELFYTSSSINGLCINLYGK